MRLSRMDKAILKGLRKRLARTGDRYWDRGDTTPGDLADFARMWRAGEPFYITGSVRAPYNGCFHEPNIWLVTPPGCDWHSDLNAAHVPTVYPSLREKAQARFHDRHQKLASAGYSLLWSYQSALRASADGDLEAAESHCGRGSLMYFQFKQLQAEVEQADKLYAAARKLHPEPLLRRERSVWPLYATGQGEKVGEETAGTRTCQRVLCWLANGCLPQTYGGFDSFTISEMQPISELAPAEHYWATAIRVADQEYDLSLTWKCGCCNSEVEGCEDDGPTFTGYRGNGGIGVFMEGAICDECLEAGSCRACYERGCPPHERWDQEVFDGSRSLCQWCEEDILDKVHISMTREAEAICDAADCVELVFGERVPGQLVIPGVDHFHEMLVRCSKGEGDAKETVQLPLGSYIIDIGAFHEAWTELLGYDAEHSWENFKYGYTFGSLTKNCVEMEAEEPT